jgi:hypothetical protein
LDYDYDSDYLQKAQRAGFIKAGLLDEESCTREQAACMAAVLYEMKSGEKIAGNQNSLKNYKDYSSFDAAIISKVSFAVENGFVPDSSSGYFNPRQEITRGELMYMLEKALVMAGDID